LSIDDSLVLGVRGRQVQEICHRRFLRCSNNLWPAVAQGVLRIGMTASDIPLTTGQPDNGGEGMRFMGLVGVVGLPRRGEAGRQPRRLVGAAEVPVDERVVLGLALALVLSAPAVAQGVLRIGMTASDIPLTTGQPLGLVGVVGLPRRGEAGRQPRRLVGAAEVPVDERGSCPPRRSRRACSASA
jgi:hypothetical protein